MWLEETRKCGTSVLRVTFAEKGKRAALVDQGEKVVLGLRESCWRSETGRKRAELIALRISFRDRIVESSVFETEWVYIAKKGVDYIPLFFIQMIDPTIKGVK